MAALGDLLEQLDTDPVRRGSQFERICHWFLRHDPVYARELRHVWLWKDWPQRWGADAGIDLVAEDRLGRLWAIQAKAYNPAVSITKRDVDTFLAESGRPEFAFRLLIATTNLIGRTAKRTLEAQEKQASVLLRGDLEVAAVDWPRSPADLRPPRLVPNRPRPHQREAIDKVIKGFDEYDRGQLIMACGTGKTLTALFINEELAAERTLVLLPSLSLLAQTLREWTSHTAQAFDFLPVCSDETVADPDAAVANTSDLGFPVTTAPEEIATFLRRRSGPRVVFATYQSSPQIADAFRLGRVPAFDLVIADEAHRCAGRVSSGFGTILDAESIKADRRLFMTATPRYFTGRVVRQAKDADFEVASMDDEEVFGPVFHRLGFAEAIERKLLTDYQVAVVAVDDATYRDWAQRGRFVTTDGAEVTDARTLAGQIGLAQAMRRYDLHRTITFHSRVKRAHEFARSLPEVISWMPADQQPLGQVWSDYASGEMPAGQRHALLHHLGRLDHGQRGLLANARCLAEGVDVPTLDSVAFIDPRRSEVDIVQAVGRAIRLAADKTIGTIVIPVFVDTDEDPAVALDNSVFKPVWDVIKALRSHDSQLGEHLDGLRRQLGRQGEQPRLPTKIHLDLPEQVGADFARAFDVRLVEQTTAPWEFWFGLLEQFVGDHGHSRVPNSYIIDGYRLGPWVTKQRSKRTDGTLDLDRVHRLEELAGWSWDPKADQWEDGFRRLLEYVDRHGDAKVPVSCRVEGYPLGNWVNIQRTGRSTGVLEADRERRLQAVTGWTWSARTDEWEDGFQRLLDYLDVHGNARVPASYTVEGYRLGVFVNNQRHFYAKGTLRTDRQERFEALTGWTWSPRVDQWEDGLARLLDYVDTHGNARVPASYAIEGYRLGAWVSQLRGKRADGVLDADRQRQLEALTGWTWDHKADHWEESFQRLLEYVERHGDARVPTSHTTDGFRLGGWVGTQRTNRAKGTLEPDREQRLQELTGWTWDHRADRWEEGFKRLLEYVEQHGDARVPARYVTEVEGYRLGVWVNSQRTYRAKGALESDRERRLEAVTGWTWDAQADLWEEGFRRLLDYVETHGDARVPHSYTVGGYQLSAWIGTQRTNRTKGALDGDRERRLQELTGWTWDHRADRWEEGFRRLLDYVETHGDARVLQSYVVDGYRLGSWVTTQRLNRAKGALDADRERRLQELTGWTWDGRIDNWEEYFRRLLDYVERHGNALVPYAYRAAGYQLGAWVATQRASHAKGTLDTARERRLQAVTGWTWGARNDQWEEGFRRLLDYVENHGDPRVPQSYVIEDYRLGSWVRKQRAAYTRGTLLTDRQRRLEELTGWKWPRLPSTTSRGPDPHPAPVP
ncbi:Helicase associated domain protein [Rhodococcus wratislaviensis]|uniref:DEAD/DEAH box helicase n=1 Tax=Rhodococcus wratislaviensis TaxID=44752 RepID=UPI0035131612